MITTKICKWNKTTDGVECKECGTVRKKPAHRICNTHKIKPNKDHIDKTIKYFGDRLETILSKAGITEERIKQAKAKFGAIPRCKCKERKDFLNNVDKWLRNKYNETLKR